MDIQQKNSFEPIVLVLKTKEEAEVFWSIIRKWETENPTARERQMCIDISNWFSSEATL